MTPGQRRDFEAEWPELEKKLNAFLARKGVPLSRREDIVQETATRLLHCWPSVDRSLPLGAFACTIALNLLRDEARRVPLQLVADVPDICAQHDVAEAGIARVELQRVVTALASMQSAQRAVLLREIGEDAPSEVKTRAAEKMMRHRARRKLSLLLQRMSAAVSLRFFRLYESGGALFSARDGAFGALTCATCLLVGVGGSVVLTSPDATAASSRRSGGVTSGISPVVSASLPMVPDARALRATVSPRDASSSAASHSKGGVQEAEAKDGSQAGPKGAKVTEERATPGDAGGDPTGPSAEVALPTDVPGSDSPEAPGAPPLPDAPSAPAPPPSPDAPSLPGAPDPEESPPDVPAVVEVVEAAVDPQDLTV